MTWREAALTLQLSAERKFGAPYRAAVTAAWEQEQARVAQDVATLKELERE